MIGERGNSLSIFPMYAQDDLTSQIHELSEIHDFDTVEFLLVAQYLGKYLSYIQYGTETSLFS